MCSSPSAPPPPAPPPAQPKKVDESVQKARKDEKARARAAAGRSSTIITGADGATSQANTQKKTLLGH